MSIITLTTDFGTADGYVGAMRGVILSHAPEARLVDLSHEIPPQEISRAAFVLCMAAPFFPPSAVHLVVVDPGVGTERRAIALRTPEGSFVGPDNGVFTYVLAEAETWTAVELTNAEYHLPGVSDTFHGRDLFAPAAAHLAAGVPLEELGRSLTNLSLLPLPRLTVSRNRVEGEVLHADRFGNLITSVGRLWWQEDHLVLVPAFGQRSAPAAEFPASTARVELAERTLTGVHRTYGAVPMGRSLALVGSSGFLEIGVRQGSAAEELGACRGEPVVVTFQ